MQGHEDLADQVCDPISQIVVTSGENTPFLKFRAWYIEDRALQLSQLWYISGGTMP